MKSTQINLKTGSKAGNTPNWKEDLGFITSFIEDHDIQGNIIVNAFEGRGALYTRKDKAQVAINVGTSETIFDGTFSELVEKLKQTQEISFENELREALNLLVHLKHALTPEGNKKVLNIIDKLEGKLEPEISFENYAALPEEAQQIIEEFDEEEDPYQECEEMLKKLKPHGYSFEYGLDGVPYNLHKL